MVKIVQKINNLTKIRCMPYKKQINNFDDLLQFLKDSQLYLFEYEKRFFIFDYSTLIIFNIDEKIYRTLTKIRNNIQCDENERKSLFELIPEIRVGFISNSKIKKDIIYHDNNIETFNFYLTDRCNLICKYCTRHIGVEEDSHVEMNNETISLAVDYIFKNVKKDFINITFTGGEPLLLVNQILYAIPLFRKYCEIYKKQV